MVTWSFNSAQFPSQDDLRILQATNNSLVIFPVQTSDGGPYVCSAINTAGNDSATLQLIVYGKLRTAHVWTLMLICAIVLAPPTVTPVIQAGDIFLTVVVGDNVTMTCTASGDPALTQSWTRNGVGVAGPRFQVSADGSDLTVSDIILEDEGMYTCHASNIAGTDTDTVTLDVIGESHGGSHDVGVT